MGGRLAPRLRAQHRGEVAAACGDECGGEIALAGGRELAEQPPGPVRPGRRRVTLAGETKAVPVEREIDVLPEPLRAVSRAERYDPVRGASLVRARSGYAACAI